MRDEVAWPRMPTLSISRALSHRYSSKVRAFSRKTLRSSTILNRIPLAFGLAGLGVKHRLDAERQEAVPLVLLGNMRHCQYLPINLSASKVTSRFYDSYGCMHVP